MPAIGIRTTVKPDTMPSAYAEGFSLFILHVMLPYVKINSINKAHFIERQGCYEKQMRSVQVFDSPVRSRHA